MHVQSGVRVLLATLVSTVAALSAGAALAQTSAAPATPAAPARVGVTVSLADYAPIFARSLEAPAADDATKLRAWAQQEIAARLLNDVLGEAAVNQAVLAAWPKYDGAKDTLTKGFSGLTPSPVDSMNRINGALRFRQGLKLNFVTYAGFFDGRVLSTADEGVGTLLLPVEQGGAPIVPAVSREYARIVVTQLLGARATGRSLADLAVHEGLALQVARQSLPDVDEAAFFAPGEFARLNAQSAELLRTTKAQLAETNADKLARWMDNRNGQAVLKPEAVFVGYLIVGRWLRDGVTIEEVLKTPRADMARVAGRVIDRLQQGARR
ncbi:hypothetical protein [Piscinibacterium candidicorallinum]|jgi:hypothetical protein|uniref:Uncharacterized protein n=1 Tax=Piscinibacterium candidicorallinum TaxID=1793872 RepID=A0ABV7H2X1_9BURK